MNIQYKTSMYKTLLLFHVSLILLICFVSAAHGAEPENQSIAWFNLAMGLFGGLALFLAGLDLLSEGLKKAAGDTLKTLLAKMTTNRFLGALSGAFVTAVLNSSATRRAILAAALLIS